jgi:CPA2 family monovalent cation:H+ antiporter-2
VGLLLVDVLAIGAIVIAASLGMWRLVALGSRLTSLREDVMKWLVVAAAVALAVPFMLGAVRLARALGAALAAEALPNGPDGAGLDLAAAPRRALLVALQLAIVIVAGVPLVALTQPFLPFPAIAVFLLVVLALVVPLWRSATNLHGHVRAGAQVILEALARQTQQGPSGPAAGHAPAVAADVRQLVPGLGDAATVVLAAGAPAVGQTLKALNLRGQTGATVIAIDRGPDDIVYPTAEETLREGDVLVLTGSHDAVSAARDLLLLVTTPVPDASAVR